MAGSSTGQGGSSASGGAVATGRGPGTGGAPNMGGENQTGGLAETGGTPRPGGTLGSGGAPITGGTPRTGGIGETGGAPSTGGAADAGSRDASTTARDAAIPATPDTGTGGFDPCPTTGNCKILPLGDSITAGAGAQPGDNGGYRVELFTKAVNSNKHITFVGSLTSGPSTVAGVAFPKNHEGHIGYKIDQISALATTSQALKDQPQIVLLFAGTNDEGYPDSQAGASERLGLLIDKIVTALPTSLLVVSSIYVFPGCKATNYTAAQCATAVGTYNAAIPSVVKQRADKGKHILYVDMSALPSNGLSTDGVHPNATIGYPWIGDNWYEAITTYLH